MASLTISDETYERINERAATLGLTLEQFLARLLDGGMPDDQGCAQAASPGPYPEWQRAFEAWMAEVQARAHRYPEGFFVDDSRESMYEGCGQ